jgi:hypothetical protein
MVHAIGLGPHQTVEERAESLRRTLLDFRYNGPVGENGGDVGGAGAARHGEGESERCRTASDDTDYALQQNEDPDLVLCSLARIVSRSRGTGSHRRYLHEDDAKVNCARRDWRQCGVC